MGQVYKKLAYLLDKCTDDKEYLCKNKINYFRNSEITNLSGLVQWRSKLNEYHFSNGYKETIKILNDNFTIKDGNIHLNRLYDNISIEKLTKVIETLQSISEMLDTGLEYTNINYNILKSDNHNKLIDLYVIHYTELNNFNKLLYKKLSEGYFNNYDELKIKSILEWMSVEQLSKSTKLMIDLYNSLIAENCTGKDLKSSSQIRYDKAKEYCNVSGESIYYTNIPVDRIISSNNVTNINYSNYKKFVNYNCNASLLENAEFNIDLLFNKAVKNKDYIVSAKAYFAALQDLKVSRGKKQCWICGERLGFFTTGITCKEHSKYERYL